MPLMAAPITTAATGCRNRLRASPTVPSQPKISRAPAEAPTAMTAEAAISQGSQTISGVMSSAAMPR